MSAGSTAKRPRIYVVYGNHGISPTQLEDYFEYLREIFENGGFEVYFSEEPIPGAANVLIENFNQDDAVKIEQVAKVPGTRLVLVATEFITGKTFNDFVHDYSQSEEASNEALDLPPWLHKFSVYFLKALIPHAVRKFWMQKFPQFYYSWRETYYQLFQYPLTSYERWEYWQKRFINFQRIWPLCQKVWCVSPHQMDEYKKYCADRLELLPTAPGRAIPDIDHIPDTEKDIDFLFTGTLTPYREKICTTLRSQGYKVFAGVTTLPDILRRHYLSRAKIALHIRQTPDWKYPSTMRYHKLLASGCVVVAEKSIASCDHEQFITVCAPKDLLATCVSEIQKGQYVKRGHEACLNYFESTHQDRLEIQRLIREWCGEVGVEAMNAGNTNSLTPAGEAYSENNSAHSMTPPTATAQL